MSYSLGTTRSSSKSGLLGDGRGIDGDGKGSGGRSAWQGRRSRPGSSMKRPPSSFHRKGSKLDGQDRMLRNTDFGVSGLTAFQALLVMEKMCSSREEEDMVVVGETEIVTMKTALEIKREEGDEG